MFSRPMTAGGKAPARASCSLVCFSRLLAGVALLAAGATHTALANSERGGVEARGAVARGSYEATALPLPTSANPPAQPISSEALPLKHFPLVEMLNPVPPGRERRDIDPMELILGPDSRTRSFDVGPLYPLEQSADCEQLYNRVTVLLDQSLRTRPPIFDDPATSLFAAIGAVAPPAYLLVGVSAIAKLAEERHTQTVNQRIDALRRRMADKRCYLD